MTETDGALATRLATEAGRLLMKVRGSGDGPAGDQAAQVFLAAQLNAHRADDAVLSEEAPDDPRRLAAERVWIIDPLDGTREFAERGRVDWAVHVALWQRGVLTAGAVALPALGRTFDAEAPEQVSPRGKVRLVVSRTRPPAFAERLAAAVHGELVPMGSAGAKAMAVVRGTADAYVHAGGMYEWDSAAPVAVARAAGLHTSRIDGSPLVYNRPDPWLPDLLICRPELARVLLAELEGVAA
ncbi:3'(2'),5'-bisphosphate nucleotidase CysQ [Lentzea tibetensis]|uniref:3'(2'),5'-bisphosphate nucleotidase CysQ n=1 Tax=Lentzea tibetensis TaxID=2591470 RepID=A0A563EKD4_9PSEU|nr:3'(2'),5'-bisphosphate nucleotidase CysQ [Lentzea tibetensis]TWP46994.1 3'(2'),5'-bisphosphate nucleotidase CysQ [Lentzea tibetensis]